MEGNKSISTRTTRVESLFFSFTKRRKRRRRLFFLVEFLVRSYGERKCLRHCWWDNTRCVPAQKPIPQVFFFTFELILRTSRQLSSSWLVLEWVDTFLYRPSRTKGARGGEEWEARPCCWRRPTPNNNFPRPMTKNTLWAMGGTSPMILWAADEFDGVSR